MEKETVNTQPSGPLFPRRALAQLMRALWIFLLVASFLLLVKTISAFKAYRFIGRDAALQSTITVSGEGEIFAVPDVATFTFSVTEESLQVQEAQRAVTTKIDTALAFLRSNGIEERDIKTVGYSVSPRYEYEQVRCLAFPCPSGGERVLKGYQVTQSILVKARKVDDAGKLLGGMGEIGVTDVSGLSFTVDDEDALLREARAQAIEKARQEAKKLSKDLDVRLMRIISFSGNAPPSPFYKSFDAFGLGGAAESSPVPEVPAGETRIVSQVTITYEIR